ncbi:MAG: hypothetical protein GX201_09205 [Clostridiales bacterium]|nr:hypothetical protein [Clostridiales bacterium]
MHNIIKPRAIFLFIFICLLLIPADIYADLGDTTLKYGMENDDIYELQKILSKLGFFHNEEFTNYFGDKTKQAVIDFQSSVGIKTDGIVGKDTFKHLNIKLKQNELLEKTNITLQLNDTGEDVADLQDKLKNLNFYEGDINGVYDESTKISVENFQKSRGLEPNGIAEQQTLLELYTLHNTYEADRAALIRREAGNKLVEYAKQFVGVKYVWAGSTPKGFDCSGFTKYIFNVFGVNLAHSASSQFKSGEKVSKSDLQVGDLVFFTTYKPGPSHVGIYIGSNKFIHASSGSKKVTITDLNSNYYSRRYLGARRYNIKLK